MAFILGICFEDWRILPSDQLEIKKIRSVNQWRQLDETITQWKKIVIFSNCNKNHHTSFRPKHRTHRIPLHSLYAFKSSIVEGVKPIENHHVSLVFWKRFASVSFDVTKGNWEMFVRQVFWFDRSDYGSWRKDRLWWRLNTWHG